jgi:hypothetical protein
MPRSFAIAPRLRIARFAERLRDQVPEEGEERGAVVFILGSESFDD